MLEKWVVGGLLFAELWEEPHCHCGVGRNLQPEYPLHQAFHEFGRPEDLEGFGSDEGPGPRPRWERPNLSPSPPPGVLSPLMLRGRRALIAWPSQLGGPQWHSQQALPSPLPSVCVLAGVGGGGTLACSGQPGRQVWEAGHLMRLCQVVQEGEPWPPSRMTLWQLWLCPWWMGVGGGQELD